MSYLNKIMEFALDTDQGQSKNIDAADLIVAEVAELEAALKLSPEQLRILAAYTKNIETIFANRSTAKCEWCRAVFPDSNYEPMLCPKCQEAADKANDAEDKHLDFISSWLMEAM